MEIYEDLKAFGDVCKEENVKRVLISANIIKISETQLGGAVICKAIGYPVKFEKVVERPNAKTIAELYNETKAEREQVVKELSKKLSEKILYLGREE